MSKLKSLIVIVKNIISKRALGLMKTNPNDVRNMAKAITNIKAL